jgi:hypothetical protein
MTSIVAAIVGSGTLPYTRGILPASQRGNQSNGEGVRTGTQVILANPEDLNSVDAFAASGITVGTSAVEVLAFNNNPLPRCGNVIVKNGGSSVVLLSHKQNFTDTEGFPLAANGTTGDTVSIPVLKNVSIWARCASGSTNIKLLIY